MSKVWGYDVGVYVWGCDVWVYIAQTFSIRIMCHGIVFDDIEGVLLESDTQTRTKQQSSRSHQGQ